MLKRTLWVAIPLTMMATVITGCSSDDNDAPYTTDPVELKLTRSEKELVNQSNEFAFNLFRKIIPVPNSWSDPTPQNAIISPLSITYALGMLNNGAAGETQEQINKVLGFGNYGTDSINAFCGKMMRLAPQLDPQTKVMIANNIYLNKGYELMPEFVQKAKTFYDATPETRDFADGKTENVINQWASDHTEKMIQKVFKDGQFNPFAVSYLLNAIYFKGMWGSPFKAQDTKDELFGTSTVPMMHQTHTFGYTETTDCQVLQMPYGNGSFAMTIFLPKDYNSFQKIPTAEEWQQVNRAIRTTMVDVKLPRFETTTDTYLNSVMAALGMPNAFNPEKADFTNFCNKPTYITMMKQVAKIKLDEKGTEAAAVTVIEVNTTSMPEPSQTIEFHANRPFLYVISERQSGAVFFIGKYVGEHR